VRRENGAPLPRGAQTLAAPMADTDALAAQAQGATVVVYAVNPAYWRWDSDLLPFFRQGVAVARQLGVPFMVPGSVYNYGAGMPPLLEEDTPQRPSTRKGEQRIAMEDELQALASQGLRSVLIRAGDFFGAGSGSWLDQAIAKDIRRGRLVYPGPRELIHSWAYLPDLARAFVAVAERGAPAGFTRLHFAGHTLTGDEFLAALEDAASRLGLRPARGFRIGSVPWPLLRVVGLVQPMLRELVRMSYLWRVPHGLSGARLQAFAGPLPATPLSDALVQALRELGHAGATKPAQPTRAGPTARRPA
jgi:nucleoside-diphosphate-sugar epimerase